MSTSAFGSPGVPPTWSSSDKDFITTALGTSRLWATIGHGIINEVYWPSTGSPQIRDFSFYLVGDKKWIDLKRVRRYRLSSPAAYLPALTVTHTGHDYQLVIDILPDPRRDVLLVRYTLEGAYRLVLIVAPHLNSTGTANHAWIERGMAYAARGNAALCLSATEPLKSLSCGYVGASDGWQDLNAHGLLTYEFTEANDGTVALTAEAAGAKGVLGLGFAETSIGASTLVRTSLAENFDSVREEFLRAWRTWGEKLKLPSPTKELGAAALFSATVLKIHEDRTYPGAVVASLSTPWGNSTDTLGGYHLVWPRDAILSAFALLGANQIDDVKRMLGHLIARQTPKGDWPQNYYPNGEPFWTGVQLDEAAFPVLLSAKLRELGVAEVHGTAPMIRAAVGFIARSGPATDQDRWEESAGINPFTLAVAISALIAAAPWLSAEEAAYTTALADDWNDRIESWCYVTGTPLAQQCGVTGYYIRVAPPGNNGNLDTLLELRNREGETIAASALVSMDFSYLVRLGLRNSLDPRVLDTIRVVDQILSVKTPSGTLYHRYNEDGYGEQADGRPYAGHGIGRGWPLLVGERGHLALQAGEDPLLYLETMHKCASTGGLLPEQVWDSAAIEDRGLFPGRPSGSAMPLLWSHAEFLKLLIARANGRPIELLSEVERHFSSARACQVTVRHWRHCVPFSSLERGVSLLIEDSRPFTLHWGVNLWQLIQNRDATVDSWGVWGVQFSAAELSRYGRLDFTRKFADGWEGMDHAVTLADSMQHTNNSWPIAQLRIG
jgi:glucoamylase